MERLRALVRTPLSRRYEVVAFVTGFALMAYELAASRLLAPYIGSSTYVWTSVIGVIIAALSAGYAVGGMMADRRAQPLDICWLLLASALGVTATLLLADGFLELASRTLHDPRLQGMAASAVLFMPSSFAVGMISPYLARLRNVSLDTTGRAVASLSALNAIGGICGTFCVGFIFFGFVGSRQTLLVIAALLAGASWLISPRRFTLLRLGVTSAMLLLALVQGLPWRGTGIIEIDTPTSHYRVVDAKTAQGKPVRLLVTGPTGGQSGIYPGRSGELVFPYLRQMATIAQQHPHPANILVLGGGAFTLPQHLALQYPGAHIDVVEIDPHLVRIAKQHFEYRDHPNVALIAQDARTYINEHRQKYDIIAMDVYNELSIPFPVATSEYMHELSASLQPGGIVMANVIGSRRPACVPLLGDLHATFMSAFRQYRVFPQKDPNLHQFQNIIMVYANTPLDYLKDTPAARRALPTGGTILTDNFAPTERLQELCRV